jgi:quinoprotein glucose dehydrogenase
MFRIAPSIAIGVALSLTAWAAPARAAGQDRASASGANWPGYAGDLAGTRFSGLAQITTENVGSLVQAWTYGAAGGGRGGRGRGGADAGALQTAADQAPLSASPQMTPIVVDGVMYISANGHVAALDATTGEEIWRTVAPPRVAAPLQQTGGGR